MATQNSPAAEARRRVLFSLEHGTDHLNLAGLGLETLPEEFAQLTGLRYLDLTGNRFRELPPGLSGMTDLVWLGLNFNDLTRVDGLEKLVALERLYLRGNRLPFLPSDFGILAALEELDLTGNGVLRLPHSMGRLDDLEYIELEEGALIPEQRAAWAEGKWDGLRGYLRQQDTADQTAPLPLQYVGKIILVGDEGQGKTSLQRALRGKVFVPGHRSTPGMSRVQLSINPNGVLIREATRKAWPGPQREIVDLSVWDMGGQHRYQFTHQLFFTPGAVYLAVSHPRNKRGAGVPELKAWLELVKKRTEGEAKVIVVWTGCESGCGDESLTLESLRAEFGPIILDIMAVDCNPRAGQQGADDPLQEDADPEADSEADGPGIAALRERLAGLVTEKGSAFARQWLPGWAEVFDTLRQSTCAYLKWVDVAAVCAQHGITELSEQRTLVRAGHFSGALLWRTDTPHAEDVVVLNPDWLNRAVARLLDYVPAQKSHGLIRVQELEQVWNCPDREGQEGYTPDRYPMLMDLMEINELAYRPRQPGRKTGDGEWLLVTQMVDSAPPVDLEEKWEAMRPKRSRESRRVITFKKQNSNVTGEVPDLMYLLIFRLREFSLGCDDPKDAVHWRKGMLVQDENGNVGRIELKDGELHLTVRYRLRDAMLDCINRAIGKQRDVAWQGLEKVEHYVCGEHCQRAEGRLPEDGRIRLDYCIQALAEGESTERCLTCTRRVLISALQDQPPTEDFLKLEKWKEQVLGQLADIRAGQANMLAALMVELKQARADLFQAIRMEGDHIIRALNDKAREGPRLFSIRPVDGWRVRAWTHLKLEVTLWCEESRWPVPFLHGDWPHGDPRPGQQTIEVPRAWVRSAAWLLRHSVWLLVGYKISAAAGLIEGAGDIPAGSPKVEPPEESDGFLHDMADQWEAVREIEKSLAADGDAPGDMEGLTSAESGVGEHRYTRLGRHLYGNTIPMDLPVIAELRKLYKTEENKWRNQHPALALAEWGGLIGGWDRGAGAWLWTHPSRQQSDTGT